STARRRIRASTAASSTRSTAWCECRRVNGLVLCGGAGQASRAARRASREGPHAEQPLGGCWRGLPRGPAGNDRIDEDLGACGRRRRGRACEFFQLRSVVCTKLSVGHSNRRPPAMPPRKGSAAIVGVHL